MSAVTLGEQMSSEHTHTQYNTSPKPKARQKHNGQWEGVRVSWALKCILLREQITIINAASVISNPRKRCNTCPPLIDWLRCCQIRLYTGQSSTGSSSLTETKLSCASNTSTCVWMPWRTGQLFVLVFVVTGTYNIVFNPVCTERGIGGWGGGRRSVLKMIAYDTPNAVQYVDTPSLPQSKTMAQRHRHSKTLSRIHTGWLLQNSTAIQLLLYLNTACFLLLDFFLSF